LEQQKKRRTALEREGAIDRIAESELETKLSRAKAEQGQLLKQLQETRDSLEKLKVDEEAAKSAVDRAEEDFTGSLKEGLAAEPGNPQTPAPAPTGPGPATKTELDKNAGPDALKQNANLLNQLK
jgi:hypothetical protein